MPSTSTRVRLSVAAALCVLPLGLVWSATSGILTPGFTIYGDCSYSYEVYCTPDAYIPGSYIPGADVLGAQATARVFLVFAAVVLAYAAVGTRTPFARRLVRAATVAIGVALALAVSARAVAAVVCLLAALALVAPAAWRRPRKSELFGPGPVDR